MTPADLEARGRMLYGRQWRSPMAKNLGVTVRAIQNWMAGRNRIQDKYETRIKELITRRINLLRSALLDMEQRKIIVSEKREQKNSFLEIH